MFIGAAPDTRSIGYRKYRIPEVSDTGIEASDHAEDHHHLVEVQRLQILKVVENPFLNFRH